MKFCCKPSIEFSREEYLLVNEFDNMCGILEDTLASFDELTGIKDSSAELNNAIEMDWGKFCQAVTLFRSFVANRTYED